MTVIATNLASSALPVAGAGKSKSQSELDTKDFLRLMTEQLKQQDPFAPTDNTQMVAQMAQMASSSGISEMNTTLKGIAAQLTDQTAVLNQLVVADKSAASPAG